MKAVKRLACSILFVLGVLGFVCLPTVLAEGKTTSISEFPPLGEGVETQTFAYGTSIDEIIAALPETISGTVDGVEKADIVVDSWRFDGKFEGEGNEAYNSEVNGPWLFKPTLTGYDLAADLQVPAIKIYLLHPLQLEINNATGTEDNPTVISLSESYELNELIVIAHYNGPGTEPDESRHVKIIGNGHEISRADDYIADEDNNNILLTTALESTVTLQDVTITGKRDENQWQLVWVLDDTKLILGEDTTLRKNNSAAISNHGNVDLLSGAVIEDCIAEDGGAIYNGSAGIVNIHEGSVIRDCGNDAISINGGAIYSSGIVNIWGGLIDNCIAKQGGAISNSGTLKMQNSRITNCQGGQGGAIFNGITLNDIGEIVSGTISVKSCEFEKNKAMENGGVIFVDYTTKVEMEKSKLLENSAAGNGGAVFSSGELSLNDNTIEGNKASRCGGGVAIYDGLEDYQYYDPDACPLPTFEIKGGTIGNNTTGDNGGGLAVISNWGLDEKRDSLTGSIAGVTFSGNTSGEESSAAVYQYANEHGGVRVNVKDTVADKVLLSKNLEAAESRWTVGSGVAIGGNSLTLAQGQSLYISAPLTQKLTIKSSFASQKFVDNEVELTAFKVGDVIVHAAPGYTITQADLDHIVTSVPLKLVNGEIVVGQTTPPGPDPTPTPTPRPTPKTGDEAPLNTLFLLMGLSLCLGAITMILRRREGTD